MNPEHDLQSTFVTWLSYVSRGKLVWFAVPNAAVRGPRVMAWLKAEGFVTGAPDLVVAWQGGGVFLEFKAAKGKVSKPQAAMAAACEKAGVAYAVVRSLAEAQAAMRAAGWGG
jgi:hypothetical protein